MQNGVVGDQFLIFKAPPIVGIIQVFGQAIGVAPAHLPFRGLADMRPNRVEIAPVSAPGPNLPRLQQEIRGAVAHFAPSWLVEFRFRSVTAGGHLFVDEAVRRLEIRVRGEQLLLEFRKEESIRQRAIEVDVFGLKSGARKGFPLPPASIVKADSGFIHGGYAVYQRILQPLRQGVVENRLLPGAQREPGLVEPAQDFFRNIGRVAVQLGVEISRRLTQVPAEGQIHARTKVIALVSPGCSVKRAATAPYRGDSPVMAASFRPPESENAFQSVVNSDAVADSAETPGPAARIVSVPLSGCRPSLRNSRESPVAARPPV